MGNCNINEKKEDLEERNGDFCGLCFSDVDPEFPIYRCNWTWWFWEGVESEEEEKQIVVCPESDVEA